MRSALFLIFTFDFSVLLSLAVMCPYKVLRVSLVVLNGGSGVGAHMYYEQIQVISMWHVERNSPSGLMSLQAGTSHSHWPWFPVLCHVAAAFYWLFP